MFVNTFLWKGLSDKSTVVLKWFDIVTSHMHQVIFYNIWAQVIYTFKETRC